MSRNPNPDRVTDALWGFWTALDAAEPGLEFGGIYADKKGYHNTRSRNAQRWPGNYSIRDRQDQAGPADKASAIDITFPEAQRGDYRRIAAFCRRLDANRDSPVLKRMLREWYGQLDNDRQVEGWDFRYGRPVTSDDSHLWHIHLSFNRGAVDDVDGMGQLLAILTGAPTAGAPAPQQPTPEPDPEDDDMKIVHGTIPAGATTWLIPLALTGGIRAGDRCWVSLGADVDVDLRVAVHRGDGWWDVSTAKVRAAGVLDTGDDAADEATFLVDGGHSKVKISTLDGQPLVEAIGYLVKYA